MSAGRYWMRLSRFFMTAASWGWCAAGAEIAQAVLHVRPGALDRVSSAVRMATARQAQGAPSLSAEIRGPEAVAEVFAGHGAAALAALIDGNPGAGWAPEGRARAALVMRWREGRMVEIEIVADPRRLQALQIVL